MYLAEIRRQEAWTLLRNKHWIGAFYLAGYTLECALKALLAKKHGGKLPGTYATHDIETLRAAALPFVASWAAEVIQAVPVWSHLLRYDCRSPRAESVVRFVNRVKEAYRCLSIYV